MNKKLKISISGFIIFGITLLCFNYFVPVDYSLKSLFSKKSMKTENTETLLEETSRSFSCEKIPSVSFIYKLSSGWTLGQEKKEILPNTEANTLCKVYLDLVKNDIPTVSYLYVRKTPIVKGVDIGSMMANSQGIHYSINTTYDFDNKELPNYGVDFYTSKYMIRVGLELGSRGSEESSKLLNKDLFFKSVIDSFDVIDA